MRFLGLFLILVSLSEFLEGTTTPSFRNPTEPAKEWSSCFAELGCLNTTEEWYHPIYRPHNPLPNKRHTVKTTFIMHHRSSKKEGEIFVANPASIRAAGFDREVGTTILIHDFTSFGQTGWIKHLTEAILGQAERNVIAVDWETGALPPYVQAVSNARVVALEIQLLLRWLAQNFTVSPNSVHLIGHGVGAHIAGYVGDAIRGLSRITALDPSGPLFAKMPPAVRLDSSDASFVDVIHTDIPSRADIDPHHSDGQGMWELCGHMDFFPNGGRDQPNCYNAEKMNVMKVSRDSIAPGSILPDCSHKRAFKYYIESISVRGCEFLSFQCKDYETFQAGNCMTCGPRGNRCSVMGQAADRYQAGAGKYFSQTASSSPFCSFLYNVELHLANPTKAKSHVSGILTMSLVGKSGPPITMPIATTMIMKHGDIQHLIAFHRFPYVNPVAKAQLSWRYKSSLTHPNTICIMCADSLFVSKLVITSLPLTPVHNETTVSLCSCDGAQFAEIKSNHSHVFVPCFQEAVSRWHQSSTPAIV